MPVVRSSRPGRWLLPAVLGLQILVFLPSLVTPGLIRAPLPKLSEATDQNYPWDMFWREEVRAGRAPFWNPYLFGGTPLIGEPQAQVFYPNHALGLVLPPEFAFKLGLVLHVLLGSWLMYRLVRQLGADRFGSAVAALAFGLHAQMTMFVYAGWIQMIAPMAWAPGVVWLLCRALQDPRRWPGGAMAAAGAMLGVQILSGHPEWVRYTLFIVALLIASGRALRASFGERLVIGAGIVGIGLLISGPQLLPLVQGALHSVRGQVALAHGVARKGAGLPLLSLPTILAPALFGPWDLSLTTDGLVHKLSGSYVSFAETLIYVGLLPLLLALMARRQEARSGTAIWVAVAATGVVFSLNDWTHAQNLFDRLVPIDDAFRSPGRFVFLTNFALAVLAGIGASGLNRLGKPAARMGRDGVSAAALLAVIAASMWLLRSAIVSLAVAHLRVPAALAGTALGSPTSLTTLGTWAVRESALSLARAAGLLALSAATIAWAARRLTATRQLAVLAVIVLDLGWFAHPFLSSMVTVDAAYAHDRTLFAPVAGVANARIAASAENAFEAGDNVAIALRVRSLQGYESFHLAEWDRLSEVLASAGPDGLKAAGVTHVVARLPNGATTLSPLAFPGRRTWWTDDVHVVPNEIDAVRLLPDVGARGGVVLEASAGVSAHAGEPAGTTTPPQVIVDEDVPGHLRLHLTAPREGWVVVTESMYPGWTARVNGTPAPVLRSFGIFQAVQVPSGSADVELAFRPSIVRWGVGLMAIGVLVCLVLARSTRPRQRHVTPVPPMPQ